jgi:hypothetical protein
MSSDQIFIENDSFPLLAKALLSRDDDIHLPRHVVRQMGINETLILTELINIDNYARRIPNYDGWFFAKAKMLTKATTLKEDAQNRITNKLMGLEIIEKKLKGIPATNYFKINYKKVIGLFENKIGIRFGSHPNQVSGAIRNYSLLTKEDNNISLSSFLKNKKEDNEISANNGTHNDNFVSIIKRKKNSASDSTVTENKGDKKERVLSEGESESTLRGKDEDLLQSIDDINRDLAETQVKNNKSSEKPQVIIIPKTIQPFIAVWESYGFKLPGVNTKSFNCTIQSLKKLVTGTLFRQTEFPVIPYDLADFSKSVQRLQQSLSPDYYPLNKTYLNKITLKDFLYNPFATSKSLFFFMLQNEPIPVRKEEVDYHPEITELIIAKFKKEILNVSNYTPPPSDKSKFVAAAARLNSFFEINSKHYPTIFRNIHKQVECLYSCIKTSVNGIDISPGFFCSDATFSRRLPTYLNNQGYTKKENTNNSNFSIYR